MTVGLAGAAGPGEGLGGLGALRPERPAPERAKPRPAAADPGPAIAALALPALTHAHFLIHQLLAQAPELGRASPCPTRTLAAYQARLADRVRYFGPVLPVDLRV